MKKRKIIFLFIFIIILISIFFIYKNMTKKSKGGNNMSSQEIVDYILNINSYKSKINVQVISNKKINKYIINQEFNKESGCIQEVIEPSNIAGTKITIKDGNLIVENSNLNLTNIFENYKGLEKNDLDLNNFIEDCKFFNEHTIPIDNINDLSYDNLIFENGQGLLLSDRDKDEEDRTPSNTGISDALNLIKDIDKDIDITAHYVTRPYLTRHGIGNLTNECIKGNITSDIKDDVNVYNEYQGCFRYGELDIYDLHKRILSDVGNNINYEIELTHCDEVDKVSDFKKDFKKVNVYHSPII